MSKDPDFIAKLKYYKTAWSKMYESYVQILGFHFDDVGDPIIKARVPGEKSEYVLFRSCELSEFCL